MNLALATFSVVRRVGAFRRARPDHGLPGRMGVPRASAIRVLNIRRPSRRLVAGWHISPETGRLECRWSLKDSSADDPSCSQTHRAMGGSRRGLPSWRPRLSRWR
jgi:hypothetical protein